MSSNPFNNLTKNDILDAFSSLFNNDGRTGNPQANLNVCTLFCYRTSLLNYSDYEIYGFSFVDCRVSFHSSFYKKSVIFLPILLITYG